MKASHELNEEKEFVEREAQLSGTYLCLDQNETELLRYLSPTLIQHGSGDVIMVCAYNDIFISGGDELDLSNLKP